MRYRTMIPMTIGRAIGGRSMSRRPSHLWSPYAHVEGFCLYGVAARELFGARALGLSGSLLPQMYTSVVQPGC